MIWIDIQRMQVLRWKPEPNGGTPYMTLNVFLDNGKRIHNEILQYESFYMIPDIHYFSEENEFIATLRVVPDGLSQCGWKPVILKEIEFPHSSGIVGDCFLTSECISGVRT